MTHQGNNIRS